MLLKRIHPDPTSAGHTLQLGRGFFAIVDSDLLTYLSQWHWFAKRSGSQWYAVRKVTSKNSVFFVRMHRQIMHTPKGMLVHHHDGNSLHNRRENLQNMTKQQHAFYH